MTQLGYDMDGEPVELPEAATGWRVSRMKDQSGAPGLVYGANGTPVVIPLEANIEDLRREVLLPGRYRLEAVDDKRRKLGAKFAYVCIPDIASEEPTSTGVQIEDGAVSTAPSALAVVMEAMRQNTEMAKTNADMARTIVDRFPAMMDSAAVLLRAADAGLPARKPRHEAACDRDDTANDDEGDGEAVPSAKGFDLNALIVALAPVVLESIGKSGIKFPSFAEMLDWRRAARKPSNDGDAPTSPGSSTGKAPPSAAGKQPHSTGRATGKAAPSAEQGSADADGVSEATDTGIPPLSPQEMAHFFAVLAALTPEEASLARAAAGELSPADKRAWFEQLSAMSVPDAVVRIRELLASTKPEAA